MPGLGKLEKALYNDGILFSPAIPSIIPFASIFPPNVEIPATSKLLFASMLPVNVEIPPTLRFLSTIKSLKVPIPAGGFAPFPPI